jgi:HEAT repeat protein
MAVAILAKIADERAIATLVRGLGGKADARVRRAIIWAVDEQGIDSDAVFDALAERAADRNEPRELRKDALQLLLDAEPDPRWEPLVRQALDGGLRLTVSASRAKSLDALLGERHPNVQVPGEG